MNRAYSYIRFSTPEQAKGDSLRRQLATSERYCQEHNLVLDTKLKLRDEGVSAFHGRNRTEGALSEFLRLVQRGDVPAGSVLLVESLDRLSREKPRKALHTLESIVEAGVDVVTLFDGRRHTTETLDDFTGLLASLVVMARANEESATKSRRLREAWDAKRRSGKPLGAICPGWLRLDKETGRYIPIADRVTLVKRIFKMALSGHGKRAIAIQFNKEQIPPWGVGNKRGLGWHDSYIQKILRNDAVIGIFHPHMVRDRKRTDLKAPVKGYYPAIISEEVFRRAQALAKTAVPGRVEKVSNLFTGVCFDGYNPTSPLRYVDKGTSKRGNGQWRYLVSDALRLNPSAKAARIRYAEFEKMFLDDLDGGHLHDIFKDDPGRDDATIERMQAELNETNMVLGRLTAAIEHGEAPEPLLARMRELESKRCKQASELEQLRSKTLEWGSLKEGFEREQERFRELLGATTPDARLAIRQYIRRLVKRIDVFPEGLDACKAKEWAHYRPSLDDVAYAVTYNNEFQQLFVHRPDAFAIYWREGFSPKIKLRL